MTDYLKVAREVLEMMRATERTGPLPPDRVEVPQRPPSRIAEESLDAVLKGKAVELWSAATGALFIVADEEDARRLSEPRGTIYTASEARRIIRIADPAVVAEVHRLKRLFNGTLREEI
jgi:hypothetical protein